MAVKERPELLGLADPDLLIAAIAEGRGLVTENVKDFAALARTWDAGGRSHAGLVFTHPRRFPRSAGTYVRRLSDALAAFVATEGASLSRAPSFVWWLDPPR